MGNFFEVFISKFFQKIKFSYDKPAKQNSCNCSFMWNSHQFKIPKENVLKKDLVTASAREWIFDSLKCLTEKWMKKNRKNSIEKKLTGDVSTIHVSWDIFFRRSVGFSVILYSCPYSLCPSFRLSIFMIVCILYIFFKIKYKIVYLKTSKTCKNGFYV